MMIITEEQYQQAVKIIVEYAKQKEEQRNDKLTPISEWRDNNSPNIRIYTILHDIEKGARRGTKPVLYIEHITKKNFMAQRNAGIKSWELFEQTRQLWSKK